MARTKQTARKSRSKVSWGLLSPQTLTSFAFLAKEAEDLADTIHQNKKNKKEDEIQVEITPTQIEEFQDTPS
jgi:hypothetical protein